MYDRPIRITPAGHAHVRSHAPSGKAASNFIGRWDSHTGPITKWVAEKNGHITILDDNLKPRNWSGKWREEANGVIWVQIANKDPYELIYSGEEWISNNRRKIRLVAAKW